MGPAGESNTNEALQRWESHVNRFAAPTKASTQHSFRFFEHIKVFAERLKEWVTSPDHVWYDNARLLKDLNHIKFDKSHEQKVKQVLDKSFPSIQVKTGSAEQRLMLQTYSRFSAPDKWQDGQRIAQFEKPSMNIESFKERLEDAMKNPQCKYICFGDSPPIPCTIVQARLEQIKQGHNVRIEEAPALNEQLVVEDGVAFVTSRHLEDPVSQKHLMDYIAPRAHKKNKLEQTPDTSIQTLDIQNLGTFKADFIIFRIREYRKKFGDPTPLIGTIQLKDGSEKVFFPALIDADKYTSKTEFREISRSDLKVLKEFILSVWQLRTDSKKDTESLRRKSFKEQNAILYCATSLGFQGIASFCREIIKCSLDNSSPPAESDIDHDYKTRDFTDTVRRWVSIIEDSRGDKEFCQIAQMKLKEGADALLKKISDAARTTPGSERQYQDVLQSTIDLLTRVKLEGLITMYF